MRGPRDASTVIHVDNDDTDITASSHQSRTLHGTQYFFYLLFIGFFTLAIPFRPVWNRKSKQYELASNWIQSTLCYGIWLSSSIYRFTALRQSWTRAHDTPNHTTSTTTLYFNLAHSGIHFLLYVMFFRIFHHRHKQHITDLLNLIVNSPVYKSARATSISLITKPYLLGTQFVWTGLTITSPIIGYELMCSSHWSWNTLISTYIGYSRYTFFVDPVLSISEQSQSNTSDFVGEQFTSVDKFLGSIQIILTTSHFIVLYFIVTLFGNCVVAMWTGVTAFKELVEKELLREQEGGYGEEEEEGGSGVEHETMPDTQDKVSMVSEAYRSLEQISDRVNKIWHILMFLYVLDLISWLSTELDQGLRTHDWFVKIHMFYYLAQFGLTLLLSGETFRKMHQVRQALIRSTSTKCSDQGTAVNKEDNGTAATDPRIAHIIRSTRLSSIGIGSTGFYSIDYSFIGQMIGLVITFFIISVQYEETGYSNNGSTTTLPPSSASGEDGETLGSTTVRNSKTFYQLLH